MLSSPTATLEAAPTTFTRRPATSPLDPDRWNPDAVLAVWSTPHWSTDGLAERPNVAEWLASRADQNFAFAALRAEVADALARWGVDPVGVFPNGVGGLTVAGRRDGIDVVGKWVSDRSDAHRVQVMGAALGRVGVGPAVLASCARGVLFERADPGVPVRCFAPNREAVLAAAQLAATALPFVDLGLFELRNPIAEQLAVANRWAARDWFAERARVLWSELAECTAALPYRVGHGDLHMGNVLTHHGELLIVDAVGVTDTGYGDPARLISHTAIDAIGSGLEWDTSALIAEVADMVELDAELLTVHCAAWAASTAMHARRMSPQYRWRFRAAGQLCAQLTGTV